MTNRLDNMTVDERLEMNRPSKTNYIISQCCSVDDLRCSLRNLDPKTLEAKRDAQCAITEAVNYEREHQARVTITKMLEAKWRSIQKTI